MSALRSSILRATKSITQGNAALFKAARPLSTTSHLYRREVVAEKEIPVSSYTPDGKGPLTGSAAQQYSIPVRDDPSINVPGGADAEKVVPLTNTVYRHMSPTMQNLSLMDKVAIITGYVDI
jgi:hypothetical protein